MLAEAAHLLMVRTPHPALEPHEAVGYPTAGDEEVGRAHHERRGPALERLSRTAGQPRPRAVYSLPYFIAAENDPRRIAVNLDPLERRESIG